MKNNYHVTKLSMIFVLFLFTIAGAHADPPIAGGELIGGPYSLRSHTGKTVTEKTFHGRYQLIFLGFSHCVHFCPLGLNTMAKTLNVLGTEAKNITPLFITIDPERDTEKRLAEYLPNYHPAIVGLTGSKTEIDRAVQAFRGYYSRIDEKQGYSFDHSTLIYLLDPRGKFLKYYQTTSSPEEIAEDIRLKITE